MSYVVDYHIHTHYSDGTMSPVDIVKMYKDKEYDIISITDHDGIDGLHDAQVAGEAVNLQVVPGVEIAAEIDRKDIIGYGIQPRGMIAPDERELEAQKKDFIELHILGYYFDPENEALNAKLRELQQFRRDRNAKLVEVLAELGYPVDLAALEAKSKGRYVGKPNIARALVEAGLIENVKDAWAEGKIFNAPEVKAIRKEKMKVTEAIELIKNAGGMAVLAHPGKIRGLGPKGSAQFNTELDRLMHTLKKAGMKGLECYHPDHSPKEALDYVQLAGKYHLHITEGSDFHGEEK